MPHYTGASSTPRYPVEEPYARHVILLHKPWKGEFLQKGPSGEKRDFKQEFHDFIRTNECPQHVKIPYMRAKERYTKGKMGEPTSQIEVANYADVAGDIPDDLAEAVRLYGTLAHPEWSDCDAYPYDFGVEFDWSKQSIPIPGLTLDDIKGWLPIKVDEFLQNEEIEKIDLNLPKKTKASGTLDSIYYELEDLCQDQCDVAGYVLGRVQEWVELGKQNAKHKFKPIRLTVTGNAGSGKSTLINTLVTATRRKFGRDDVVCVLGPTGCAAHNIKGKTIHAGFKIRAKTPTYHPSSATLDIIKKRYGRLIMLAIDERSMVEAEVLAVLENYARHAVHQGLNSDEPWGNIPIVIIFGDDGQLPAINNSGFQSIPLPRMPVKSAYKPVVHKGLHLFKELAKDVMDLSTIKRQDESEKRFLKILGGIRNGDIEDEDVDYLCSFRLDDDRFSKEDRDTIAQQSLYLFAHKKDRDNHNDKQLFEKHSDENPVAKIKATHSTLKPRMNHFTGDDGLQRCIRVCRGAMVALKARNILPEWGLFNGGIGTIMDIVFHEGEGPNSNDLPAYILVEFPQYTGPAMIEEHPTYVALTPISGECDNDRCKTCKRTQIPLQLAFGKTIHTFQGINVGPVREGQPPNQIKSIVCDPGPRTFEGKATGILYTTCTRGTTMGTSEDNLSSAIYFTGPHLHFKRVKFLQYKETGEKFLRVRQKENWMKHLAENTQKRPTTKTQLESLAQWIKSNTIERDAIDEIINNMSSHHNTRKHNIVPDKEQTPLTTPKKRRKNKRVITP